MIVVILSLISLIWFINYSTERTETVNERLQDANNDLDRIVDKAIVHCQTDGTGCDVLMPQWLEECKKPEMKDIPSCHDGRIENYLSNYEFTNPNNTDIYEKIDICEQAPTQNCIYEIGKQYERCFNDGFTSELCNDKKVVTFLITKNVRFDDGKTTVIQDSLRTTYSWGVYFEGRYDDPRNLIKEFDIDTEETLDIQESSLAILHYCSDMPNDECDKIMRDYARYCSEILHPLCKNEGFANYLSERDLLSLILTEYYEPVLFQ